MSDAFTVKVFFRGDWCPWCNAYLRDFDTKGLPTIRRLGGTLVAITSQVGNQSKQNNSLGFDVVVDPDNVEAKKYGIVITPKAETPLSEVEGVYENGMVQPGVVIEDASGAVLFRWAIDPNTMNMGGASDRPLVADIVGGLENILAGRDAGAFATTDMEYLKRDHPEQYDIVQAYIASMG